jgi:aspartate aminotransferase
MREAIKKLHRRKQLSKPCDVEFCEYLLEQAGVAAVPGSAFGLAGYIRISFATSMNNLKRAAQRLQNVLN